MKVSRAAYVYILACRPHGAIYTGVTSELVKRVWEHRNHLVEGFTQRYKITRLDYCESCMDIRAAIEREKHLKQ